MTANVVQAQLLLLLLLLMLLPLCLLLHTAHQPRPLQAYLGSASTAAAAVV